MPSPSQPPYLSIYLISASSTGVLFRTSGPRCALLFPFLFTWSARVTCTPGVYVVHSQLHPPPPGPWWALLAVEVMLLVPIVS